MEVMFFSHGQSVTPLVGYKDILGLQVVGWGWCQYPHFQEIPFEENWVVAGVCIVVWWL